MMTPDNETVRIRLWCGQPFLVVQIVVYRSAGTAEICIRLNNVQKQPCCVATMN